MTPVDVPTRKWALITGVCLSPLFFLFAWFDDPGRGQAALVAAGAIAVAVRMLWHLRFKPWLWTLVVFMVVAHAALVVGYPWPDRSLAGGGLLPFGLVDYFVVYYTIELMERLIEGKRGSA